MSTELERLALDGLRRQLSEEIAEVKQQIAKLPPVGPSLADKVAASVAAELAKFEAELAPLPMPVPLSEVEQVRSFFGERRNDQPTTAEWLADVLKKGGK